LNLYQVGGPDDFGLRWVLNLGWAVKPVDGEPRVGWIALMIHRGGWIA